MATDKVVAVYKADVTDYVKDISKATGQAQKDFEKVNKSAGGLEKGMKKIGGAVAAAFAVDRIVSFTAEASKLAAAGEGIRKAFERVGDPKLLQGLRDATRGTVSDLNLMKGAVQAENFKIPLEKLATLFEFARRRAKETGISVDYLVESIVTGLGRRSIKILDNLQLTTNQLEAAMGGTAMAAASIGELTAATALLAKQQMREMGDEVITTADRMKQLDTAIVNMKTEYGDMINKSALFYADLLGVIDLNEHQVTGLQKAMETIAKMEIDDLVSGYQTLSGLYVEIEGQLEKVTKLQSEMDGLGTSSNDRKRRAALMKELETENARLDMMREVFTEFQNHEKTLANANKNRKEQIHNVAFYTAKIKALTEEQELENTSLERNAQILKELIAAQKALDLLKGKERKASKQDAFEKAQRAQGDLTAMSGVGIGANFFDDTLEQLKAQLAIQQEILNTNSANSMEYVTAKENVEALTDKIENFGEKSAQTTTVTAKNVKDTTDNTLSQYQNYVDAATEITNEASNVIMSEIQKRTDYEMQLLDEKVLRGEITEEQAALKRKELRKREASYEKVFRLFQIATSIPAAIMSALAQTPPDKPGAIAAGVLGALQLAMVASQPIPQFAKGTKNAPSGFKWVGEEGPELIHDGGGYPIITHRESMKILEKYNIESVDIDSIQRGGFDGMAASAKLQGFSDSNMLVATDRLRESNKRGFVYMADRIAEAMKKSSRNEW